MTTATFDIYNIENWEEPLYQPCQYKVYYGGRDSGKSTAFAKAFLRLSFEGKFRFVCCREYFGSIGLSVYSLFVKIISLVEEYKPFFKFVESKMYGTHIINVHTGSMIFFKGLRDINVNSIKSVDDIKYLWLEEGSYISKDAWTILFATLRTDGCELWVSMNPRNESDFLYNEFIINGKNNYGSRLTLKKISWRNNRHLSKESMFNIQNLMNKDFDEYIHAYEGECKRNDVTNVFKKEFFKVFDFEEPQGIHPYYGLDFGWTDASAGIRCYIQDECLYVTHEFKQSQVSVDCLGDEVSKCLKDYKKYGKYTIVCDSSSPDLINLLIKYGYPARAAIKGKGSIEAGITYIKTFKKCYVHPRCVEFLKEVYNLKYEVDKHSGQIKDKIEDKNNHLIDCWRYSLEDCMKNRFNIDYSSLKRTDSNVVWV